MVTLEGSSDLIHDERMKSRSNGTSGITISREQMGQFYWLERDVINIKFKLCSLIMSAGMFESISYFVGPKMKVDGSSMNNHFQCTLKNKFVVSELIIHSLFLLRNIQPFGCTAFLGGGGLFEWSVVQRGQCEVNEGCRLLRHTFFLWG